MILVRPGAAVNSACSSVAGGRLGPKGSPEMKVALFCDGLGTRLREHSDTIPKPLANVGKCMDTFKDKITFDRIGGPRYLPLDGVGQAGRNRFALSRVRQAQCCH
jgi:hypothetical protein